MKLVKLFRIPIWIFVPDVNELDDAIKLINLGVDSITTDFPLKMKKKLKSIYFIYFILITKSNKISL